MGALAALIISISANTATDALITLVDRAEIEVLILRNRPFVKTQEFVNLKTRPISSG